MFTALRRIGIVVFIAIAFTLGLAGTVYLSLRSPEVTVPEVVGQHYLTGQATLEGAGLNIRKRARRYKGDAKPDMILDQSPRAGIVVKKGQTVAVVVANDESGDKMPEPTDDAASEDAKSAPAASPEKNSNAANAAQNENQNRDRRNSNSNKNSNKNTNANKNANNQNANNRNRNTNNANANANSARNANRNANNDARNRNANTSTINRNANNANANRSNANRNANTPRGGNVNRNANRPTP